MSVLGTVTDPEVRTVVLTAEGWAHIIKAHSDLKNQQAIVLDTVAQPDYRLPDPIRGRERYWRQGKGPSRWLRTVVDFNTEPAQVVTAFAERRDPPGWKP